MIYKHGAHYVKGRFMIRDCLSPSRLLVFGLLLSVAGTAPAQPGPDELRKKLSDIELVGKWFYDDLDGAEAEAKKANKPLLIVFRCVT